MDSACTAVVSDVTVWYEKEEKFLKVFVPFEKVEFSKFDDATKPLFFLWISGSTNVSVTYVARAIGTEKMSAQVLRPLLTVMKAAIISVGVHQYVANLVAFVCEVRPPQDEGRVRPHPGGLPQCGRPSTGFGDPQEVPDFDGCR